MDREHRDMRTMSALLKEAAVADAEVGIRPFLTDRVMRRLAGERSVVAPQEEIWQGLLWIFKPVATVSFVLVLVLAAHNLYVSSQYEIQGSAVESVLALPEVNTVAALDLDLTAYSESANP